MLSPVKDSISLKAGSSGDAEGAAHEEGDVEHCNNTGASRQNAAAAGRESEGSS